MTARLDNFTDAAFAFAVSLLVIGGGFQRDGFRVAVEYTAPVFYCSSSSSAWRCSGAEAHGLGGRGRGGVGHGETGVG